MASLTNAQLSEMGFASFGDNVMISDKASFYGASRIHVGNNVRIDDFCILSAGVGHIFIGNYVHIACHSTLIGAGAIRLSDYVNLSSRVSVYSSSDDYSGHWMTSPVVPSEFTNVDERPVEIGKHCIIGTGSVVLPGSILPEGCAFGAMSMANGNYEPFSIYGGVPARLLKSRSRELLSLEKRLDQGMIN